MIDQVALRAYAEKRRAEILEIPEVINVEIVGSIRRGQIAKDVDLLIITNNPGCVPKKGGRIPKAEPFEVVDGFFTSFRDAGPSMIYSTGPRQFNRAVMSWAAVRGWKFEVPWTQPVRDLFAPPGRLFRGSEHVPCATEEEFFELLGLPYFAPEEREIVLESSRTVSGSIRV